MIVTRLQVEHMAQEIRNRDISERLFELLSQDRSAAFNLSLEPVPDGQM